MVYPSFPSTMIKKMKIRMEFGDASHPLLIVEKIFLKRDRDNKCFDYEEGEMWRESGWSRGYIIEQTEESGNGMGLRQCSVFSLDLDWDYSVDHGLEKT